MREIQLIEVKSEIGAGTRGASLGPDAIEIAALDYGSRFFKRYPSIEIPNENTLLFESSGSPFAKRISGVLTVCERVADEIQKALMTSKFPVVLAGDHSSAAGTIAGIKAAFPRDRIGVIWIDAHADLHSPYTSPTGNMHGMPVAISLNEDNFANQVNQPDQEVLDYWFQLKNLKAITPKILPADLVYIGVRDAESPERALIKKKKIRNIPVTTFRKLGAEKIINDIMAYLDQCDKIYISFDVDVLDPRISRGTGTPVPNGFTEREAGNLLTRLCRHPKICCFELVEVNPTLDTENLMAENAYEILARAINALND